MSSTPRRRRTTLTTVASILAAGALLLPAAASADRPLGKYYCWAGGTYYGTLKLSRQGTYNFNDGTYKGRYAYKAARKLIVFTSGPFERSDFYGLHRHDSDGDGVVYVRLKGNPNAGWRCG